MKIMTLRNSKTERENYTAVFAQIQGSNQRLSFDTQYTLLYSSHPLAGTKCVPISSSFVQRARSSPGSVLDCFELSTKWDIIKHQWENFPYIMSFASLWLVLDYNLSLSLLKLVKKSHENWFQFSKVINLSAQRWTFCRRRWKYVLALPSWIKMAPSNASSSHDRSR